MSRGLSICMFRTPLLLLLPALLCACQPQPQPADTTASTAAPSEWPGFDYEDPAAASGTVFVLDPRATRIDVVVRRNGPLARFGHDHVVTVGEPDGFLLLDDMGPDSRADLRFRLDKLVVDSAEARVRRELDTDPDAAAIEGTRENLLEHVLDAGQWPWATLGLTGFERQEDHYSAMLTVAISGSAYTGRQPFRLQRAGDRVRVDGFFILRQTELGIEPFSALGGGLRVADPLEIYVRIEATRY
jgi:hypothetical protein